MTQQDVSRLFGNIEQIYAIQQQFNEELKAAAPVREIGMVFNKWVKTKCSNLILFSLFS